jgi:hypothetical protein
LTNHNTRRAEQRSGQAIQLSFHHQIFEGFPSDKLLKLGEKSVFDPAKKISFEKPISKTVVDTAREMRVQKAQQVTSYYSILQKWFVNSAGGSETLYWRRAVKATNDDLLRSLNTQLLPPETCFGFVTIKIARQNPAPATVVISNFPVRKYRSAVKPSSRTKGTSKTILIALVVRFVMISSSGVSYSGVSRPRQSLPAGANSFNLRRTNEGAKHAPVAPVQRVVELSAAGR